MDLLKKNILIDIDGTISEDISNEERHKFADAAVLENAVKSVNKLYDEGHIITFFTARSSYDRDVTENWLKKNNFRYTNLLMDKPRGGNYIWIDNLDVEGIKYNGDWNKVLEKISDQIFSNMCGVVWCL